MSLAQRKECRRELARRFAASDETVFLLTLGRLVRRKGARWFVDHVLPQLPTNVHYIVAGEGPEAEPLRAAVEAGRLTPRVHLLGSVDDETRELVMQGADLFVQPNIRVPGDMEGFGLVTIESALRGTPVAAADLEGIKDAVVDGETGILLPPEDAGAWALRINELVSDRMALEHLGQRFRVSAGDRFGEESMGEALFGLLSDP